MIGRSLDVSYESLQSCLLTSRNRTLSQRPHPRAYAYRLSSMYILYARRLVDLQLPFSLSDEILDCAKVFLVEMDAFLEFSPIHC